MTTPSYTAQDIQHLREELGVGISQCKRAFELAFGAESDLKELLQGDVVWAAGIIDASGLAVHVTGGPNARRNWNIEIGAKRAEMYRERTPRLNELFPIRMTEPRAEAPRP